MRACLVAASMVSTILLSACGVGQSLGTSTANAAKWAFTTQVKTLRVDLVSRAAINPDAAGQPLSTVIRLYQLKTPNTFEKLSYAQLQTDDMALLKGDMLDIANVVLRPGTSESVTEPMHPEASYVGVAAFFRDVDHTAVWKMVLPKSDWKKRGPVTLEVQGSQLRVMTEPTS